MPLTFSIVVNTCDRAAPLRTLLYALNRQSYPHFEVVVVIGPTKDNSVEVVEEFGERVILVRCPEFNLSMSRNMGIAAAVGEIIAFIDDDAVPCLTWLEQLAEIFQNPDVAGAGGKVYQIHPGHGQLQFRHGRFSILGQDEDVRAEVAPPEPPLWFPRLMGANMTYRRALFSQAGGFDERFPYLFEEPDLAIRWGLQGHKIVPLAEAVVYHAPASSRNREMFTWNINWYLWLRGMIYFTLKNATSVVGRRLTWQRAMLHGFDFFRRVRDYRRAELIDSSLYAQAKSQLWRGLAWGWAVGLGGARQIPTNFTPPSRLLRPFLSPQIMPHIQPLPPLNTQTITPMSIKPLRIGLLTTHYPPKGTEGIARHTHLMALGLAELGHEVHVITAGRAEHTTFYDGAYIHEIVADRHHYPTYPPRGYVDTAWQLNYGHAIQQKVRSLRLNHQIQVIDSPLWSLEGLVTAVAQDVPVAIRLATGMRQIVDINQDTNPDTRLISDLEVEFLQLCQGFTANSLATTQTLRQVYGLEFTAKPHQVVYHGIIPAPDAEVQPLPVTAKREPIILFVGRLEKRKGVLDIFEAMPQVLREFPQAQFWFAGKDNSDHDGFATTHHLSYPEYFQRKYPRYQEQVKFLGYVPDNKLNLLYQICDMFVAPSLYESFGLIFVEAMNYARPVIGCNVGGPAEIILPGETGLLVPPQAPFELATAIIHLLQEPQTRRAMGLAGRARVINQFHYRTMAAQYAEFYRQLIA